MLYVLYLSLIEVLILRNLFFETFFPLTNFHEKRIMGMLHTTHMENIMPRTHTPSIFQPPMQSAVLKHYLGVFGLSEADFAGLIGYSCVTIHAYCEGKKPIPRIIASIVSLLIECRAQKRLSKALRLLHLNEIVLIQESNLHQPGDEEEAMVDITVNRHA